jgi:hypothetical protein
LETLILISSNERLERKIETRDFSQGFDWAKFIAVIIVNHQVVYDTNIIALELQQSRRVPL